MNSMIIIIGLWLLCGIIPVIIINVMDYLELGEVVLKFQDIMLVFFLLLLGPMAYLIYLGMYIEHLAKKYKDVTLIKIKRKRK